MKEEEAEGPDSGVSQREWRPELLGPGEEGIRESFH